MQVYDALQLLLSLARYLQPLGPSAVHAVLRAYAEADTGGRQPDLRAFESDTYLVEATVLRV